MRLRLGLTDDRSKGRSNACIDYALQGGGKDAKRINLRLFKGRVRYNPSIADDFWDMFGGRSRQNDNASTGSAQAPVEVEAHFRPLFLDSPLRNHRLQNWFKLNEQFGVHDAKIGDCVIPTPTVSFNAVYQLTHIYRHLFDEGVGLRQLMDYYFVLRALHVEQGSLADRTQNMSQWAEGMGMSVRSNAEILHTLSSFGMRRFASAVMYVLQTVFAMPNEYFICQPNEKEGKLFAHCSFF